MDCIICTEPINKTEPTNHVLPCAHVFHPECITTWLNTSRICPICKHPVNVYTSDQLEMYNRSAQNPTISNIRELSQLLNIVRIIPLHGIEEKTPDPNSDYPSNNILQQLWDDVHYNSLETPNLDQLRRLWREVYDEIPFIEQPPLVVEQPPLVVEIPPLVPAEMSVDDDPVSSELPQNDSDLVPVDLPEVPPAAFITQDEVRRFWDNVNQHEITNAINEIISILD